MASDDRSRGASQGDGHGAKRPRVVEAKCTEGTLRVQGEHAELVFRRTAPKPKRKASPLDLALSELEAIDYRSPKSVVSNGWIRFRYAGDEDVDPDPEKDPYTLKFFKGEADGVARALRAIRRVVPDVPVEAVEGHTVLPDLTIRRRKRRKKPSGAKPPEGSDVPKEPPQEPTDERRAEDERPEPEEPRRASQPAEAAPERNEVPDEAKREAEPTSSGTQRGPTNPQCPACGSHATQSKKAGGCSWLLIATAVVVPFVVLGELLNAQETLMPIGIVVGVVLTSIIYRAVSRQQAWQKCRSCKNEWSMAEQ